MNGPPLLRGEGLLRRYGARPVLDLDLLELREGEVVAVLGPNGAGKSTLFRILLLLEAPDAGRVLLRGREVRQGDTAAMRQLAGVFQRPVLFGGTVADNVAFGLRARGVPRRERQERVGAALEELGLASLAHVPVSELSGGEAQRVALGRALVVRPAVVLLDEPSANLDVTVRRRFRTEVERLVRRHAASALLVTHDPADAFALADRVIVLEEGRAVQSGSPEELVAAPATPFVAEFTGAELLLDGLVEARSDGMVRVGLGGGISVLGAASPHAEPDRLVVGSRVHVAYRPEDVLLVVASSALESSARNRLALAVDDVSPAAGLVRVRLRGAVELVSLVTRESAAALGLAPGVEVAALLKASALRVYPGRGEP